jgi:DNA modification methylase
MVSDYDKFLQGKRVTDTPTGIPEPPPLNEMLFPFQRDIVKWALKRGRAAIFADCGLGKTPMQLEWARVVAEYTGGRVLILAPLAVSQQTVREGSKFGIPVTYCREQSQVPTQGVAITNYEMLDHFIPGEFTGVVLDESSILKNYTGKFRTQIITSFAQTPFRLACTATPAPNDHMELGNHAEFLGTMTRTQMLSMFFVHDGGDTAKWRIKGHAEIEYWKWVCSWAVMMRKPSDLGYSDDGFILPPLEIRHAVIDVTEGECADGLLFRLPASTLSERQSERRLTTAERVSKAAEIVNSKPNEPWLAWCDRNGESEQLTASIPDATEVTGADKPEDKEDAMLGFSAGAVRILVTKPSIAGFGMNWQHCHNVVFVGLSDSYEQFYQAIRRCWRFGQTKPVTCWIVTASTEGAVVANIERKEQDARRMADEMVKHMHVYNEENIRGTHRQEQNYREDEKAGNGWRALLGDCVTRIKELPDNSIGFSIYSPPFSSLYTYSNSDHDMGNSKDDAEFFQHYEYLIAEQFRTMMPGRCVSVHCMNLPTSKERDGYIGIRDFRGDIIRAFQRAGFIYHSEVCIWKDPVVAMQRTKALGLLHKQLKKDSCMSRQGVPDYLVTFRKPGTNADPVSGELAHFAGDADTFQNTGNISIDIWQRYASPVWMDINPSRTLQKESAREEKDERHVHPLQLDVIERALQLWSKQGDTVFSPFMGIGSEGWMAVQLGRKFIGIELKESYWKQACANIESASKKATEGLLFTEELL